MKKGATNGGTGRERSVPMLYKDGFGGRTDEKGKRQGLRKVVAEVLLAAAICFAAAGCGDGSENPLIDDTPYDNNLEVKIIGLKGFESCDEMDEEARELLIAQMEGEFSRMKKICRYVYGGGDDAQAGTQGGDQAEMSSGPTYTGTNVQEAGVDEGDLMKTDGTYVYSIVGDSVEIARAWPFEKFGKVAALEPKGVPQDLYLLAGRLVVLSTDGGTSPADSVQRVFVEVFDVGLPASPKPVKSSEHRGELVGSRMVGPMLHLIVGSTIAGPSLDYIVRWNDLPECPKDNSPSRPTEEMLAGIDELRKKNMTAIDGYNFSDSIPIGDAADRESACGDLMRSHLSIGSSIISVISQDINSANMGSAVSIAGASGTVYASPGNIYVAERYNPIDRMFAEDLEERTVIHRFSIADRIPKYSDTGSVAGHMVDNMFVGSRGSDRFSMSQFAMSEREGHLRVATTIGTVSASGSASESRVTVLSLGSGMPVAGEVGGLGLGERIYSVRFVGDRGYVVTFKKVDPLYVIDLSDPANPVAAGELKIPGFSTYLHPVGDGRIIGIGFDADDQGPFAWTQGLKLAMFDVSDAANPIEAAKLLLGSRGSYSTAVEEHHAFTLDAERGILALPIDLYEGADGGSTLGTHSKISVELIGIGDDGSFNAIGEVVIKKFNGSYGSWYSGGTSVLRTIIIGDGDDEGVITLTSDNVYLHRIDEEMTKVGAMN